MPKPIIWSNLSENDFDNILDYLDKNWGHKVAANFIDLTENIVNQISINPRQFPICYKRKKSEMENITLLPACPPGHCPGQLSGPTSGWASPGNSH